jgi:subtilisin family serine protease
VTQRGKTSIPQAVARRALLLALAAVVCVCAASEAGATRRVIVRLRDGSGRFGAADRQRVEKDLPVRVTHAFSSLPAVVLEVPDDVADDAIAGAMNARWIEPDLVVQMAQTGTQTEPWGITRVRAQEAWARTRGAGISVGVIDSGVDTDHPDLIAAIAGGYNTLDGEDPGAYEDLLGHGTHVAGTIAAADNGVGVIGVAPEARLYAVRVFGTEPEAWVSDIVEGLLWCVDNGMDVVNMSLGLVGGASPLFEEAVATAAQAGVVMVAAAGNHNLVEPTDVAAPGSYPQVITVSSVDSDGTLSSFSNYGPEVDFAAPGSGVESTYLDGSYSYLQGTSMATPHVTGVVALALAAGRSLTTGAGLQLLDDLVAEDTVLLDEEEGEGVIDAATTVIPPVGVLGLTAGVDVQPSVVYTRGVGNVSLAFTLAETAGSAMTVDEVRVSIVDDAGVDLSHVSLDAGVDLGAGAARAYSVTTTVVSPGAYEAVARARVGDWQDIAPADGATNPTPFTVYESAPVLAGPPDGSRVVSPALLEWQGVFQATNYEVSELAPAATIWAAYGTSDTRHDLPLTTPGDYRWRARAFAGGEWLGYSAERTFTYGLPGPDLVAPPSGTDTYDPAPTLTWTGLADAISYDVQVSAAASFDELLAELSGHASVSWQYAGPPLVIGSTYFWRVRASTPIGVWSEPAAFRYVRYVLTTAVLPPDTGAVTPDMGDYALGDVITLTATPADGHVFGGWQGDHTGTENPAVVTIEGDMAVTAAFALPTYTLTTGASPPGSGEVTPGTGAYVVGDVVTLSATPATGYEFTDWDGASQEAANPLVVTIEGDKAYTANFALTTHALTASAHPVDGGTVMPATGTAEYGSVVEFSATPEGGFLFVGWGGDASGVQNPLSVTVTTGLDIVATFAPAPRAALAVGAGEAALNATSLVTSVTLAPEGGAAVDAVGFALSYDPAQIATATADADHAALAGWTVVQVATEGRVEVSASALTPAGVEGHAFRIAIAAAAEYWGSADLRLEDGVLNGGAVLADATDGSVFFPHLVSSPSAARAGDAAVISVAATVPTGATSAVVAYRRGGDAEYGTVAMALVGSDAWSASLPAAASTTRGIAYYVEVTGVDGRVYADGAALAPHDAPVAGDPSIGLVATPHAPSQWNLVAPTVAPDDSAPSSAFARVGAAYTPFAGVVSPPQWLAWRWQAAEQEWRPAVAFDQYAAATDAFAPAAAWFLVVEDDPSLAFTVPGRSVDAAADHVIALRAGWNLLANPFAYSVDWSDASVLVRYAGVQTNPTHARLQGWVHDRIFWYDRDSDAYVPQASGAAVPYALSPGQGFWLYAGVDGAELAIPPVESFPSDPPVPPAAAPSLPPSDLWSVSLAVRTGDAEDAATAGVGDVTDGLDHVAPPPVPASGRPSIAMLADVAGRLTRVRHSAVAQADEMVWRVSVIAGADANITWDTTRVPSDYGLFLEADGTDTQIDMRRRSHASLRELSRDRLNLRAVRRDQAPAVAALLPNYPNPFNPETWIPFELAEAGDVDIAIYGVGGSLVRTIHLGRRAAGRHLDRDNAGYWDGRTSMGDPAASGVYIYEVRAAGMLARRRMVLLK